MTDNTQPTPPVTPPATPTRQRNFAEDQSRRVTDRQQRWVLLALMTILGLGAAVFLLTQ